MSEDTERLTWIHTRTFDEESAAVVGESGAVEVWREFDKAHIAHVGGVEVHRRHGEGKPDTPHCKLLDGPCWHDVSSLDFDEDGWRITWNAVDWCGHDDEPLYQKLTAEYEKQFIAQPTE